MNEHADLDISGLTAVGEVGGGDQRLLVIDDQALGVQAGVALRVRGSGIVEELGLAALEGPVQLEEVAFDCYLL